jgi:hypothetical protein
MQARRGRGLASVAALAAIAMAGAARTAAADDHVAAAAAPASDLLRLGVMGDVGVPDGATASVVVRPVRLVRLNAGVGTNAVTTGVRGGVSIVPLSWWCSPTVSVDVGRYPEGDANHIAQVVAQDPTFSSPMLEKVGYWYVDAHLGLELGRTRATFYIHGGVSRISGRVHGLSDPSQGVTFTNDPKVTAWAPSVRVGLIVYAF